MLGSARCESDLSTEPVSLLPYEAFEGTQESHRREHQREHRRPLQLPRLQDVLLIVEPLINYDQESNNFSNKDVETFH